MIIALILLLYLLGVGILAFIIAKYIPKKAIDLMWLVAIWPITLGAFSLFIPILIPLAMYFIIVEYIEYSKKKPNYNFWIFLKNDFL